MPPQLITSSTTLELFDEAWNQRQSRLGWTLWFILARSFMDFLFKEKPSLRNKKTNEFEDDILATDFKLQDGTAWWSFASQLKVTAEGVPGYKETRAATNKNAAHLTYARIGQQNAGPEPAEVVHRFLVGVANKVRSAGR